MRDAKTHILKRLMRTTGMSAERLNEMHKAAEGELWRARCWNCKAENIGKGTSFGACKACGVNLMKRT